MPAVDAPSTRSPVIRAALVSVLVLAGCSSGSGAAASASASAATPSRSAAPSPSTTPTAARPSLTNEPVLRPTWTDPGVASGPKVHGVPLAKATVADVVAAFDAEKCTHADATTPAGHALDVTCGGHAARATFILTSDPAPEPKVLDEMTEHAAVARDGAALLAIRAGEDAKLADDLLRRITSSP